MLIGPAGLSLTIRPAQRDAVLLRRMTTTKLPLASSHAADQSTAHCTVTASAFVV